MLAYHLLTWVRETLRHSGAPRDWNSLRRLLSTHCLITTVLPLNTGTVLRIRKPSQPDAKQQHLYDNLGIDWRTAFPAIKTTTTPCRLCSAFGAPPQVLCTFTARREKLGWISWKPHGSGIELIALPECLKKADC